jgi:hypothetical protein
MTARPSISVVIVASDSLAAAQAARESIDDPSVEVPSLRRLGVQSTRGDVVAFLEDSCLALPGWIQAIQAAFLDPGLDVVSGPVVQANTAGASDWAVYFAEYASFARQSGRIAGPNFACRRRALNLDTPIREHELTGRSVWVPAAAVRHVRRYRFRQALADRYRFGCEFGQIRWTKTGIKPWTRLGRLAAPAILAIQFGRLARAIAACPSLFKPLVWALIPTLLMLTAWSMGEAQGWSRACRSVGRGCETAGQTSPLPTGPAASRRAGYKPAPDVA